MNNWSLIKGCYIEVPENIIKFLNEITKIYKKYNLSLSHEDTHGSFIIEKYDEYNIKWLKNSLINVEVITMLSDEELDLLEEIINDEIISYLESGYKNTSEYVVSCRNILKKLNLKELFNYEKE